MSMEDIMRAATYYDIDINEAKYLCRNVNFKCRCGKFKLLKPSTQSKIGKKLYRCCGNTECEPLYCKVNNLAYILTQKNPDNEFKFIENALIKYRI